MNRTTLFLLAALATALGRSSFPAAHSQAMLDDVAKQRLEAVRRGMVERPAIRLDVPAALDLCDATRLLQSPQRTLELLLAVRRQAQLAQQFRGIQGQVSLAGQQAQDF